MSKKTKEGRKEGRKETAKERLGRMHGHISSRCGHSFKDMSEATAQSILNAIDNAVAKQEGHTTAKS